METNSERSLDLSEKTVSKHLCFPVGQCRFAQSVIHVSTGCKTGKSHFGVSAAQLL